MQLVRNDLPRDGFRAFELRTGILGRDGQRVFANLCRSGTFVGVVILFQRILLTIRCHCDRAKKGERNSLRSIGNESELSVREPRVDRDRGICEVDFGDGQLVAPHGRLPTVSAVRCLSADHAEDIVGLVDLQVSPAIGIDRHIGGIASVNAVRAGCHIACGGRELLRCTVLLHDVPRKAHLSDVFIVCFQRKRKGDRIAADGGAAFLL